MRPRVPAIAYAFCACLLLVLGPLAFPIVDGFGPSKADAAGITATPGATLEHTTTISASWGSIPTTLSSGTPPPGSLTETFPVAVLLSPPPEYFFSFNSGNTSLVGTTYTVTVSQSGGLLGVAKATLTACLGATWTSGGSCSTGNTALIGNWTAGSAPVNTTTVPAASGSRLSIQTSISGLVLSLGSVTVVLSTNVNNSSPLQIRAAATTNA
jgi:hypothetical protein